MDQSTASQPFPPSNSPITRDSPDLKTLIRSAEDRYVWYTKELESLYKSGFGKLNPDWMSTLKEAKNFGEAWLKKLREEQTNANQGLNPPYCYPEKYWKKS
jgi:hypothetical protein